jgi:hypothetical protein
MPWIPLTEADARTVLSAPELQAYRTQALADGQPDPLPLTIAQVVELVRGYVAACPRNTLGAGDTIPAELLAPTLDLLAVRLTNRVGQEPGELRRAAAAAAIRLLEQVAACRFDLEAPATPEAGSTRSTPTLTADAPQFARQQQEGV